MVTSSLGSPLPEVPRPEFHLPLQTEGAYLSPSTHTPGTARLCLSISCCLYLGHSLSLPLSFPPLGLSSESTSSREHPCAPFRTPITVTVPGGARAFFSNLVGSPHQVQSLFGVLRPQRRVLRERPEEVEVRIMTPKLHIISHLFGTRYSSETGLCTGLPSHSAS